MMDDIRVPIYLVTGFLESGKTTFLDFTLQQEYFAIDGKTLLILCEEGEEEYDMDKLKLTNTVVEVIEDEEDLTPQRLAAMDIIHQPERVVIEYNGMWLVSKFEQMELPEGWGIEQEITCVDATTYQVYMANMKSLFMDMIRNTDMVVFNRCKEGDPLPAYRRGIKVANQSAEVIFENEEGEMDDIFQNILFAGRHNSHFRNISTEILHHTKTSDNLLLLRSLKEIMVGSNYLHTCLVSSIDDCLNNFITCKCFYIN